MMNDRPTSVDDAEGSRDLLVGRRVVAWLADVLILTLGMSLAGVVLWGIGLLLPPGPEPATTGGAGWLVLMAAGVVMPVGVLSYLVGFTAGGATPGKRLVGLQVVTTDDGGVPYMGRAAGRLVAMLLLGPVTLAGMLHGDRRAYHDRIAGLRVVRTS